MKKYLLIILTVFVLCTLIGCKSNPLDAVITLPTATEPTTEAPTVTQNPFEGESEIDFSDIVTVGPTEPDVTEAPEQTEDPVPTETTKPQAKPTEPVVTEPTSGETEAPEETQTPTTASPYGPDGYNNQIVRP